MTMYVIKVRPFKLELQQVIVASDEFTIIFGMVLLYSMYYYQNEPKINLKLGAGIIAIVAVSLIKNILVIVGLTIKRSYISLRTWFHTKYNIKKQRRRLRREARERAEKERKEKEDQDLLEYGPRMRELSSNNPSRRSKCF